MGSSGWSIRLEPLENQTPAAWAEVREATMQFLWETWRDALPSTLLDEAWNWVSLGEDSLLTIGDPDQPSDEPVDRIMFWFYLSVEWPSELADHWLHMAFASGRERFEQVWLKELGYRIAGDAMYPELGNNRHRFAAVEQVDAATPIEGGPCQCPLCVNLGISRT